MPGGKCLKLVKRLTRTADGPSKASVLSCLTFESKTKGRSEFALPVISISTSRPFSSFPGLSAIVQAHVAESLLVRVQNRTSAGQLLLLMELL